jgi:hypothetical protein
MGLTKMLSYMVADDIIQQCHEGIFSGRMTMLVPT